MRLSSKCQFRMALSSADFAPENASSKCPFPLLTLLDAPDFTRLATGNPKSGPALPPGSGGSRGDARRHPFPSPLIHRELAFQAQIPRPSRQRVLANQLRRGVLNSPVESAKLEPVLCRQVSKHGNSMLGTDMREELMQT